MSYSVPRSIASSESVYRLKAAKLRSNYTYEQKYIDRSLVNSPPSLNVYLLERRINCMTVASITHAVKLACMENRKITVANYNIHAFNLSMQLPWFYQFLESADITNCDSMGILKAISYMGLDLPLDYRASYTLLMPKILELAEAQGLSIFLLGGKPDVVSKAVLNLKTRYPHLKVNGHHGYFDRQNPQENQLIIQTINQHRPNILLVGMGMPIQEEWVKNHRDRLYVNAIMLGGAIIDRLAGFVADCPPVLANLGLEWLYRLYREPKRLAARYLLGNPAFAFQIALAKFYAPPLRVELMPPIY